MLPKNQIFVFEHMVSDEMCDKVISLFQEVPLREEKYGKNCNVECKIFKEKQYNIISYGYHCFSTTGRTYYVYDFKYF